MADSSVTRACTPRLLQPGDHAQVLAIYNHYVAHSHCTFDTQPFTLATRVPWFAQFAAAPYQCLVAEQDNKVLGYACSMRFKEKPAYHTSIEVSIYVAPDCHTQGVGSSLYDHLLQALGAQSFHRAYAGITLPNDASVALHEKFGFRQTGLFTEVGYKFERYWDVAWFEKALA